MQRESSSFSVNARTQATLGARPFGKRIRACLDTGYRGSLTAPSDRKSFFAPFQVNEWIANFQPTTTTTLMTIVGHWPDRENFFPLLSLFLSLRERERSVYIRVTREGEKKIDPRWSPGYLIGLEEDNWSGEKI